MCSRSVQKVFATSGRMQTMNAPSRGGDVGSRATRYLEPRMWPRSVLGKNEFSRRAGSAGHRLRRGASSPRVHPEAGDHAIKQ